jgi:hypothetical protein
MRHLIDEGILANSGSIADRARRFESVVSPILENPSHSFNWKIGATEARAFVGVISEKPVVVFVAKEGLYQGRVLSAVVPDAKEILQWGIK